MYTRMFPLPQSSDNTQSIPVKRVDGMTLLVGESFDVERNALMRPAADQPLEQEMIVGNQMLPNIVELQNTAQ